MQAADSDSDFSEFGSTSNGGSTPRNEAIENDSEVCSTQGARRNFQRLIEEDVEVDEDGNLTIRSAGVVGDAEPSSAMEISEIPTVCPESTQRRQAAVDINEDPPRRNTLRGQMRASCRIESDSDEEVGKEAPVAPRGTAPRRRPRKSDITIFSASDDSSGDGDIFKALKRDAVSTARIVQDWLSKHSNGGASGAVDFLQFLIFSCGSKYILAEDVLQAKPMEEIIEEMAKKPDGERAYPIIRTGKGWKKFGKRLYDFIYMWASECGDLLAGDTGMFEMIMHPLISLSRSPYRAFRHTATIAALRIGTALLRSREKTTLHIEDQQRQLRNESEKSSEVSSGDRVKSVDKTIATLNESLERTSQLFLIIVDRVLRDRYCDIAPEIRCACLIELRHWMKESADCVDEKNLKYIAIMSRDDVAEVRRRSLEALEELFENSSLEQKLSKFTLSCKNAILEMVVDDDVDVAVCAVKVVANMYSMFKNLFTRNKVELIYSLMYTSWAEVASAAAKFFYTTAHELYEGTEHSEPHEEKDKVSRLLMIAKFFSNSDAPDHARHLVDALIPFEPILGDYETFGVILTSESKYQVTQDLEQALISLLNASAQVLTTGLSPPGRTPVKNTLLPSEITRVSKEAVRLTEALLPFLPALLNKFLDDAKKTAQLLAITERFKPKVLRKSSHEESVKNLLEVLADVIERSACPEVLEASGKCLALFSAEEAQSFCEIYVSNVIERVWNDLCHKLDAYTAANMEGDDMTESLMSSLKKASCIAAKVSFEACEPWSVVKKVLDHLGSGALTWSTEMVKQVMQIGYYSMFWSLKSTEDVALEATLMPENVKEKVEDLRSNVSAFVEILCTLLLQANESHDLSEICFRMLCDLIMVFSAETVKCGMGKAVLDVDDTLMQTLITFLEEFVLKPSAREADSDSENSDETLSEARGQVLGLFCKLISARAIQPTACARIFMYYPKVNLELEAILKASLLELKSNRPASFAQLLLSVLEESFKDNQGGVRDVAWKFAQLLNPNGSKDAEVNTTLHREGISFAFATAGHNDAEVPPNLEFFKALAAFTNKLGAQDRITILNYLTQASEKCVDLMKLEDEDGPWQPLVEYRDSLGAAEASRARSVRRVLFGRKRSNARASRRSRPDGVSSTRPVTPGSNTSSP